MKKFRCGDVVPGCTRSFVGTEDAILAEASAHARHDHGVVDVSDELVASVRGALVPA